MFDLADVLCEELWRQGDLKSANGMEYTSPMNDRSHIDKPKSQIGFYTFVCLPLYQATAKAVPPLECNVNQVLSNLAVWKHRQELAAKSRPLRRSNEYVRGQQRSRGTSVTKIRFCRRARLFCGPFVARTRL